MEAEPIGGGSTRGMRFSTIIPFHGPSTYSFLLLERSLRFISFQKLRPLEVIISTEQAVPLGAVQESISHSGLHDDMVRVVRNPGYPGIAQNTNHAASMATGDVIHPHFYDDFLPDRDFYRNLENSLQTSESAWNVVPSHLQFMSQANRQVIHKPHINPSIALGVNTIGPPSAVAIRRDSWIDFTVGLTMLVDCTWYAGLINREGAPYVDLSTYVAVSMWDGQTQKSISSSELTREYKTILEASPRLSRAVIDTAVNKLKKDGSFEQAKALRIAFRECTSERGMD